ncbi:DUF4256 domain-containing protein [Panacibacter sp. DH6]|uniref:DUF4256 domain-containing protein n=1 Tax=Panacibacter microcysteis TaxID=2793269 RepID=A0A931E3A9_9BACT|nr:DUF4256 domain-containing protein [Panacibacter microcysteis]MBG9377812.1 DUF4256 domain-containing protein [Panacibacter microcysteis]
MPTQHQLSKKVQQSLLHTLQNRFEKNMARHKSIVWKDVQAKLQASPGKMWSLNEMEITGGEPDVIHVDSQTNAYIFCDCAPESPKGRRSLCYDTDALNARKENKPAGSAVASAAEMGIELLDEEMYRLLQGLGVFDTKTSSWIATPPAIRTLGGALFCDRRYNTVFVYHNGAESYYAARGFRGLLRI